MWPYVRYFLQGHIKILNICFPLSSVVNKSTWQYQWHNKNGFNYGFLTTAYSFEIWSRGTRESFWGALKVIISGIDLDFSKEFFCASNSFISRYFLNKCSNFYDFLLKRSPLHLGTIINFFAMWQFKVCLNICSDYKSDINNFSRNLEMFLR